MEAELMNSELIEGVEFGLDDRRGKGGRGKPKGFHGHPGQHPLQRDRRGMN